MKWQNEKVGNRFHCSFFLYHPVVTCARGMCLRRCFSLSNSQKLWLCMEDILANEQGWDHRIIRRKGAQVVSGPISYSLQVQLQVEPDSSGLHPCRA